MRGGRLDTRVRIERAEQGRTRKGEVVTTAWAEITTVWAGSRTMAAAEKFTAQQVVAEADVALEMRAWPGPQVFGPEDRFRLVVGVDLKGAGGYPAAVVGVVPSRQRGGGFMVMARTRAETTAAPE
jgi:head-tail adaptor